jgi:hypothetical protein
MSDTIINKVIDYHSNATIEVWEQIWKETDMWTELNWLLRWNNSYLVSYLVSWFIYPRVIATLSLKGFI